MFAKFEIRRLDVNAARKLLGAAIGMCPKEALFKGYIELEVEVCCPQLTGALSKQVPASGI
jgi:crooked neck